MQELLLLKMGELSLKGLNRRAFEEQALKMLRRALAPFGEWQYNRSQSTLQAIPLTVGVDMQAALQAACRVFGFAGCARACRVPKDMAAILPASADFLAPALLTAQSFKCEAKRSDKAFPLQSPEICEALGEALLNAFPHLRVEVRKPDVIAFVEIREQYAFLHGNQTKGAGGLPVGTAGDAAILISGGIDSPVAAWMMAKRGVRLTAIHFASPPYTSPRAEEKVHHLLQKVASYAGRILLLVVPFTEFQESLRDNCPEDFFTVVMRRGMMRCAEALARKHRCGALITGESLGQVASQTMGGLQCTDAVTTLPVFRPLIGMDKEEVVQIARKIDTFETSILPYEDCCTVFTPRRPKTKPRLAQAEQAEAAMDMDGLLERACADVKEFLIS
jgi:thiamine biosynthesis protein ThiI